MKSTKAKKPRSVEAPKASHDTHATRWSASTTRPGLKERTRSAPMVASTPREDRNDRQRREFNPVTSGLTTSARIDLDDGRLCSHLSSVLPEPSEMIQVPGMSDVGEHLKVIPELNFAVVSERGAGKSTFVRCALDLEKPTNSPASSKRMSLEGEIFLISLFEVQLSDLVIVGHGQILWPQVLEPKVMPRIDGALVLFDVMNRDSICNVPNLLDACARNGIPCVLVSCKCDYPPSTWQIDPRAVEEACTATAVKGSSQTTVNLPQTHKRCISIILRSLTTEEPLVPQKHSSATESRAQITSMASRTITSSQASDIKVKHRRTASETTGSRPFKPISSPPLASFGAAGCTNIPKGSRATAAKIQASEVVVAVAPFQGCSSALDLGPSEGGQMSFGIVQESLGANPQAELDQVPIRLRPVAPLGTSTTAAHSISEVRPAIEEDDERSDGTTSISGLVSTLPESDIKEAGLLFESLVDRLLSPSMLKSDTKFAAVFLCLYRKFAAPAELMSAIIRRFQKVNNNNDSHISQLSSQLRYIGVIAQWITEYPGDFAYPPTHRYMAEFVAKLANIKVFAVGAKEISTQLNLVSEDDDTEWACSDSGRGEADTVASLSSMMLSSKPGTFTPQIRSRASAHVHENNENPSRIEDMQDPSIGHPKAPSSSSSTGRSDSQSGVSFPTVISPVEVARRQAHLLTPTSRIPLTKSQWHQFMDISNDEIARELTRIDWIMFSSIRPRDLVRHVSLAGDRKEKCKQLVNVDRMIDHFNYVAFWVANVILLRDKPKHRAQALEKFMTLAWKLRQLNNYNSLGAVVAGINGIAVYRLAQTREMVSQQVQKDFMRLEILMGTQKSHFAYRLAWENTSSERIPFLPLHRRDLISTEEGNRTLVGDKQDRINWRKFEIMGDAIIGIQRSQSTPYPNVGRNADVQRLVLDGKFSKDDDELYERSIYLERPGAGESTRGRFNWFQR